MRIHHLNCVTMCPPGRRLTDGRTGARGPAVVCCHCVVVELPDRLVLVDTGFGLEDVRAPRPRLAPLFLYLLRPRLREDMTAARQLVRLGFTPDDVADIILTHLDFDHAGGLDDFPNARVHLLEAERQAAVAQSTPLDRRRFRPRQWSSMGRWLSYPAGDGERWFDFAAVRELEHLPPELALVPLAGHTLGHAGVAIFDGTRWLLHAGDAYFFRGEMDPVHPHCTIGLRAYQWLMEKDRRLRLANQERLRTLVRDHGDEVRLFCAHDALELDALQRETRGDDEAAAARRRRPRLTTVPPLA